MLILGNGLCMVLLHKQPILYYVIFSRVGYWVDKKMKIAAYQTRFCVLRTVTFIPCRIKYELWIHTYPSFDLELKHTILSAFLLSLSFRCNFHRCRLINKEIFCGHYWMHDFPTMKRNKLATVYQKKQDKIAYIDW